WFMRSILHFSRLEALEFSRWIKKTTAYSREAGIGYWQTLSSLHDGWRQARAGDLAGGTAIVQTRLEAYLASGSRLSLTHFSVLIADLRLLAGDREGALAAL